MRAAENIANVPIYYFAHKLAEVRSLIDQGKDIINLGIGSPDGDTPPSVVETLKRASLSKGSGYYQPYDGIAELRQAFAHWYKRVYGVSLNPDNEILPLMGSKEAIMYIHLAFCNPGDTVLAPNPGYPAYSASAKTVGLHVEYYNLYEENHWLPSVEELERRVTNKCKVMWINYPHMPIGARATKEDLEQLIAFADKHGLLLVNDNPYSLILNQHPLSIHACNTGYQNVLELNSLSKSYNMAGWRVGVVSGDEENIHHILKVKSNFDSGMYKPIQLAAVKALSLKEAWLKKLNSEYAVRATLMWKMLDELTCTYQKKHTGIFVWAKVSDEYEDASQLSDHLLYHYDIFATPGYVFGSNGKRYMRFSLCASQQQLKEALRRIKNGAV